MKRFFAAVGSLALALSGSAHALCASEVTPDDSHIGQLRAVSAAEISIIDQAGRAARASLPNGYAHPAMMAVGDSMYNGVTSLALDGDREKLSVPALVAASLNEPFQIPRYPRPILADIEKDLTVNTLSLSSVLAPEMISNIKAWQAEYPLPEGQALGTHGGVPLYDNLASSGYTSGMLLCTTAHDANSHWRVPRRVHPNDSPIVTVPFLGLPKGMLDYHMYINGSFLLNPQDRPEFLNLSQMAEVIARQPLRLLINIGSNDGVWTAGFRGDSFDEHSLDVLLQNMKSIASLIPEGTQYVYVSTLVPPSRVPNMVPKDARVQLCGGKTYYRSYEPYVSDTQIHELSGQHMCDLDLRVSRLNADIEQAMRSILSKRIQSGQLHLRFVRFDNVLWTMDRKHDEKSKTIPITWNGHHRDLDNGVIRPDPAVVPPPARQIGQVLPPKTVGGMTGYDNMHPTMVMYGVGAQWVLDAIAKEEKARSNPGRLHPVVRLDRLDLPQCVANALTTGNAGPNCPAFGLTHSVFTSLDMTLDASHTLNFLHRLLGGTTPETGPGGPYIALLPLNPNAATSNNNLKSLASACVLAAYMGVTLPSRRPKVSGMYAFSTPVCGRTNQLLQSRGLK